MELKDFLDRHISESTDTNYIDVFPLRCGIGKTTYIKYAISDALRNGRGLIVITDSLKRMKEYTSDSADNDLVEYVSHNLKRIAILDSSNISTEIKTANYKPVLLMTTQRFFNLTKEEIIDFTAYRYGARDRILFDEKIYITEIREIRTKTINDIDTALHECIDDTKNQEDKAWLITEWEKFRDRIFGLIKEYEALNDDYFFEKWHFIEDDSVTEDDERFKKLIDRYRLDLNKFDGNAYRDILAVIQLVEEGATFTSRKLKSKSSNSEYANSFFIVIDNSDKLVDIGAKIFVFDGTADIDPDYDRGFINMVDCSQFKTDYPTLTIECIDLNTSQSRLCSRTSGNKTIKMLMDYINLLPYRYDALFTYKSMVQKFKDCFPKDYTPFIDYFGNIKGKNDYRSCANIIQIGLNRYPDLVYKIKTEHNTLANVKTNKRCVVIIGSNFAERVKSTMFRAILADIEQNLFRGKIRNADCCDPVKYTIVLNVTEFMPMIEMMKERFSGATIQIADTPTSFLAEQIKSRENKKDSRAQRIIDWIFEQPNGTTFKISDMLNELFMSQQNFKDAKKYNKSLVKIFKSMETGRRGYYTVRK